VEIDFEIVYYCVNTLAHLNGEFMCNWHGIVHGSVRQFLMDGILLLVAHFTGAGVLVY
jgi:hypothetical protein